MTDSLSTGNKALSGVEADNPQGKATAQSRRSSTGRVAADECAPPTGAQDTRAVQDHARQALAAKNQTPQRQSQNFWGRMSRFGSRSK